MSKPIALYQDKNYLSYYLNKVEYISLIRLVKFKFIKIH